MFTPAQRALALAYGIVCHALFLGAVVSMGWSFYHGMTTGRGLFRGATAILANATLLLLFPIAHSLLLSSRGREFMARITPLGIGRELTTTTFVILTSVQLIITFVCWSPSGVVWWQAEGWQRTFMLVPFAGAWLLLIKSMNDSQLGVQMGFLGWGAVFRNCKPQYEPFATSGLYKRCRQPIYLSFALILWTGSTWTPDQLVLAVGWTVYCVIGSAIKERRFLRFYGDAFREYQLRVPFWIPSLSPSPKLASDSTTAPSPMRADCDVLVVGGGPVGLLLANLLGARGVRTMVVEKRTEPPRHSMAIGITPPSLEILKRVGLDERFCDEGLAIRMAQVHESGDLLGHIEFDHLPTEFRFILSLPQSRTIRILQENLKQFACVTHVSGLEFTGARQELDGVSVQFQDSATTIEHEFRARYVVGCDGHRSRVRDILAVPVREKEYAPRFVMADFEDQTDLGDEAHLFFTPHASIESFPLPGNRRRWIVLAREGAETSPVGYLLETVRELTGYDLAESAQYFQSSFHTRRMLAAHFFKGRVLLCGDAAHVMSPIGGQGMNTGFADAELLGEILTQVLEQPTLAPQKFELYERVRRKAFRVAADRAARGMWLGTRRGWLASTLRRVFIRDVLFRPWMKAKLAPHFAMLTVPFNNAARVPLRWKPI